jgi:hypothetical protein
LQVVVAVLLDRQQVQLLEEQAVLAVVVDKMELVAALQQVAQGHQAKVTLALLVKKLLMAAAVVVLEALARHLTVVMGLILTHLGHLLHQLDLVVIMQVVVAVREMLE